MQIVIRARMEMRDHISILMCILYILELCVHDVMLGVYVTKRRLTLLLSLSKVSWLPTSEDTGIQYKTATTIV
jgi:hypothetical protein